MVYLSIYIYIYMCVCVCVPLGMVIDKGINEKMEKKSRNGKIDVSSNDDLVQICDDRPTQGQRIGIEEDGLLELVKICLGIR